MSDTIKPNEKAQQSEPQKTSPEEPSSKVGPPSPLRRSEWERLLKEAGWRDATLDPDGPIAFELPAPPRRQIQDDK